MIESTKYHFGYYEFFGCVIEVRCRYRNVHEEVQKYYLSHQLDHLWCSPDVVVTIDLPEVDRFLFRTRPTSMLPQYEGIRATDSEGVHYDPWPFYEPPLPPMSLPPFSGKFTCLHAAAIEISPGKAVVVVGNRGDGKSTTVLNMMKYPNAKILSDENTVIRNRSLVIEPFLRPLHLWDNKDKIIQKKQYQSSIFLLKREP